MSDQRSRILDGLLQVAADSGLETVSVRTVAAAARVSPAQVQYYYGTKQLLLLAAYERVHQRMLDRLAAVDPVGSTPELLRRFLLAWLPLDAGRRADAAVWLAFTAAAVSNPELAVAVREADAAVLEALVEVIDHGRTEGTFDAGADSALTAGLVLAAVDGLTVRALSHPQPDDLVPQLDQLLRGLRPPTAEER